MQIHPLFGHKFEECICILWQMAAGMSDRQQQTDSRVDMKVSYVWQHTLHVQTYVQLTWAFLKFLQCIY